LYCIQVFLIHVRPVAGRVRAKVVPVRDFGEEAQRVGGKEHVIRLDVQGEEEQHAGRRVGLSGGVRDETQRGGNRRALSVSLA
jgi:hypothetical protein